MNSFICYVGMFVSVSLALYILAFVLMFILNLKVPPSVAPKSMPVLRPVPIPTKKQKTFLHKLIISIFEVRKWELAENWHYQIADAVIVIPSGFQFDGASIPRPFWAFLSPVGLLLIPGLLHDYAYTYNMLWCVGKNGKVEKYQEHAGKEYWDDLFRRVADDVNDFSFISGIAWFALILGGDSAWNKHRKNNLTPTQPILL